MEKRQSDPLPLAFTSTVYTTDFTVTTTKIGTQNSAETNTYTTTKLTTSYIPILPFRSTVSSQPPFSGTDGTVTYEVTLYRPPTNLFPSPTPTSSTITVTNHNIVTVSQIAVETSEVLVGSGAAPGGLSGVTTTLRTTVLNSSLTVTYVSTLNSIALLGAAAQSSATGSHDFIRVDERWSDWSNIQRATLLLSLLICLIVIGVMAFWRKIENDWKIERHHKEGENKQANDRISLINHTRSRNIVSCVFLVLSSWKTSLRAWILRGKDGILSLSSYTSGSVTQPSSLFKDIEIQEDYKEPDQENVGDGVSVTTSLPWPELTSKFQKKHSRVHAPRWYNANTLTTTAMSIQDDLHDQGSSGVPVLDISIDGKAEDVDKI